MSRNRGLLKRNGLTYPEPPSDAKATAGRISSGNGAWLAKEPEKFDLKPGFLWSSEHLFNPSSVKERLAGEGADSKFPIVVCGYFRDPVEWAVSSWMQGVKRSGGLLALDDYISGYKFIREKSLLEWLELSEKTNVEVRFANYSRHKNGLMMHFLNEILQLNIPKDIDGEHTVNRSLTASEIELMIAMNRATGGDKAVSKLVSDSLVENLPFLRSNPPNISEQVFVEFEDRLKPFVERANYLLNKSESMLIARQSIYPEIHEHSERLPSEWFSLLGGTVGLAIKRARKDAS